MLFPLLYCLGNVFAVHMCGDLSVTFGLVLTPSFFAFQKKIKACHLFRNLGVYCLARPIRPVTQDSRAGPFFHRAVFPSSSPVLSFILSSPNPWQVQRCAFDSVVEQGAEDSAAQCCLGMVRWPCFPSEVGTNTSEFYSAYLNTPKTEQVTLLNS